MFKRAFEAAALVIAFPVLGRPPAKGLKAELLAARAEADRERDLVNVYARVAIENLKGPALLAASRENTSHYQGQLTYPNCRGGSHYAREPVAKEVVRLLRKEHGIRATVCNAYETISFSW